MKKDYINWSKKKSYVQNEKARAFFHEREVWVCFLGENVGFEQDGSGEEYLRPVIVVHKCNNEVFIGIPLTRNLKKGKYYHVFDFENNKSTAIISQVRLIDAKRLKYKIGNISQNNFVNLKEKIRNLFS